MSKLNSKGQNLLELVVGLGMLIMIITALAVTTTYSLRNTQFSKNQEIATKLAQENMEKVRTIKLQNYGVCVQGEEEDDCSAWEDIWDLTFGTLAAECDSLASGPGCTYKIDSCFVSGLEKPICLSFDSQPNDLGEGFTGQIFIEDETGATHTQKRITSRVFWTDTTGVHNSDLVTVFSKL